MKILYAVQATGNGHIGRARVMAAAFERYDIEVDWVFSGRPAAEYFDMQIFGNFKTYNGLSFIVQNRRLNFLKTLFSANIFQFYKDIKSVNFDQYDLLINDFEPVTAWAAKLNKFKSIGLSHQSAFLYKIPFVKRNFIFNLSMKHYAPTSQPIGIHWQQFDEHILPPIIAQNTNKITHSNNEILVYIPFHSTSEIIDLLKGFKKYNFHIFHADGANGKYDHLHFHSFSRDGFAKYMARCDGIISNAGFELPSEALQMGKKLLLEPLENQVEQIANANTLDQLNWSQTEDKINTQNIDNWLKKNMPKQVTWPDVAGELVSWIKQGKLNTLPELSQKLWAKVEM